MLFKQHWISRVCIFKVAKTTVFKSVTVCSLVQVSCDLLCLQGQRNKPSKQPEYIILVPSYMLVAGLIYSSTMKMEVVHSSETSVNLYQASCHHISEESVLLSFFLSVFS
jgi:hypothetical protein